MSAALRSITEGDLDRLLAAARASQRRRAIFRLHQHEEPVQRMVNAMLPGTYIPPHKHEDPDKVELFCILRGTIAVLHFDRDGAVQDVRVISTTGELKIVDIPPRTYHALLPLEASVALEIIEGPYDARTHKKFAPWAPREDDPRAADYLAQLTCIVEQWQAG